MQKQKKKIDGAILRIFTKGVDYFRQRLFYFKKYFGKKSLAFISLLAIIGGMYFQFLPNNVKGATYTWNQITWAGGEDGGTYPDHTDNQTNWTKYSSKDSGISTGTDVKLLADGGGNYSLTSTGTSNVDFNAEGNYAQENADTGTDFEDGKVSLAGESNGSSATGGAITYSGGYTIHTFTSSGTLLVSSGGTIEYLVVAGGGGGGSDNGSTGGGGGGAGGVLTGSTSVTSGNKTVTVGQGGTATYTGQGGSGGNSVFDSLTATGGGGGGMKAIGSSGGSGGGGGGTSAGGSGTSGQGNNGGSAVSPSGGGGGGAGEAGANGTATYGGAGGIGIQSSISGEATYYGGGGAGASPYARQTPSLGGQGGGGNGGYASQNATAGATNTGGGGGGATYQSYSAAGGSGIVIVRYLNAHPTSQAYYVTTTDSSQIDTSTYGHITGATLTQTTPANTSIKYLVSFDDRSTWKYWDGDSWESSSLDNLQTNGMSKTAIEGLSQANWESTGGFVPGIGTLDFAADLSTSDSSATPELDNIAVNYEELPDVLISSAFNTESDNVAISKIAWSENLPAGTDAKFQIQTAPDNSGVPGTWTGWQGPNGSSSYFTDPAGNETLPSALSDGVDDQWIQYRVFLETDNTSSTPTISDVDFTYAINAAPEIQNVTASQGTDGTVTVNYETRDIDTDTGVIQNQLNITLQYCTANCSVSGSETWTDAVTVGGAELFREYLKKAGQANL